MPVVEIDLTEEELRDWPTRVLARVRVRRKDGKEALLYLGVRRTANGRLRGTLTATAPPDGDLGRPPRESVAEVACLWFKPPT